jgi:cell division protein FtsW (lipid II flippase)
VTLTTSLAAEFGVPAFIVLACLYGLVLVTTHSTAVRSRDKTVRRYSAAVVPSLVMLLGVAAVGLFGSFSSMSLSWPVMILAGATSRLEALNQANEKRRLQQRYRIPRRNSPGAA